MARAIVGGLAFSTLTSLLLVPWTYALLDDLGRWRRRVSRLARAGRPGDASPASAGESRVRG